MLELKLVKESLFHKVLEAILDLVDVASVDCSRTGLKLQAVDAKLVAFIALIIPAKEFQLYHCDEDRSMGIAIGDMVKAIRSADKDDTITIKTSNENFRNITLSIESPKWNDTTTYSLRLVEGNIKRFRIPEWQVLGEKHHIVEMLSVDFMHVCKYLSNVDGDVDISATEKGIKFFVSGKWGCVNIKYMQPEKATDIDISEEEPVSLTLDLKYMNSFAKVFALSSQVKICVTEAQPLMGECKIGQMAQGHIIYLLAPKIKTEIEEEEIEERKRKRSKRNNKKSEDGRDQTESKETGSED